jgi:hypothetical protein
MTVLKSIEEGLEVDMAVAVGAAAPGVAAGVGSALVGAAAPGVAAAVSSALVGAVLAVGNSAALLALPIWHAVIDSMPMSTSNTRSMTW